MIDSSTQTI